MGYLLRRRQCSEAERKCRRVTAFGVATVTAAVHQPLRCSERWAPDGGAAGGRPSAGSSGTRGSAQR